MNRADNGASVFRDYIRRAIETMNEKLKKDEQRERLQSASLAVRDESMKVNLEFSGIEHDPTSQKG